MSSVSSQTHDLQNTATETKRSRKLWPVLLAAVFALLLAFSVYSRLEQSSRVSAEARETSTAPPLVRVAHIPVVSKPYDLTLPGNTEGIETASIYARSTGYIRSRYVDIGTRVKSGQLLALIDSPEADQDLSQGQANLAQAEAAYKQAQAGQAQAEANLTLAKLTRDRYTDLAAREVVSRQEGDDRQYAYNARVADLNAASSNVKAAMATVRAQQANVSRLERMQQFERVVSPFPGVVTTRNVDTGDLISAGGAGSRPMFTVARSNTLRVQVPVPQTASAEIRVGDTADVTSPSMPGRTFTGTIARTAEAITQNSRTLQTEVQIENRDRVLLPGMYVDVHFHIARDKPAVVVPAEALIVNASGTQVAALDGSHARLIRVELGRDFGRESEVQSGLTGSETLILNPPVELANGQQVRVQGQQP